MVTRSENVLSQYDAVAPLDGVVTNLPVRVGETVVPVSRTPLPRP